jgi:GYF domain 2
MPNQSWFYASNGQQQGPYPDAQLRELIARGTVTADTLVWSEGMAGWQRAGEIPGLFAGVSSSALGPPVVPRSGVPLASGGGYGGGALSIEFGIWDFTWRSLVLFVGLVFVIPAPWVLLMYFQWIVSCVRVPQRPNLAFTGRLNDLMWLYALVILIIVATWTQYRLLNLAVTVAEFVLYFLLVKWFVANLSSNGQPLGLRFTGSLWGFIGYSLLAVIAVLTIVGWAWVYVAQLRWMCRHIEGTRREVIFNGTGLEFLWRSIVMALACVFIIPIPWMYRWFARWVASQTVLVERGAQANA